MQSCCFWKGSRNLTPPSPLLAALIKTSIGPRRESCGHPASLSRLQKEAVPSLAHAQPHKRGWAHHRIWKQAPHVAPSHFAPVPSRGGKWGKRLGMGRKPALAVRGRTESAEHLWDA